jgi:hypothetical protein
MRHIVGTKIVDLVCPYAIFYEYAGGKGQSTASSIHPGIQRNGAVAWCDLPSIAEPVSPPESKGLAALGPGELGVISMICFETTF